MGRKIESEIATLKDFDLRGLRQMWKARLGDSPPTCKSPEIVRRLVAYRLQVRAFGGLSPDTKTRLRKLTRAFERNPDHSLTRTLNLKPGTVLAREWKGTRHQVRVLDDGFEYAGERFASLSEVARKITGTRWSGPLFFGLKKVNNR